MHCRLCPSPRGALTRVGLGRWGFLLPTLAAVLLNACGRPPRAQGPLPQEAYVWQRDWRSNVVSAVASLGSRFQRIVVLVGEVQWTGDQPRFVRVAPDPAALQAVGRPVGVALRIGTYGGPFRTNDAPARFLDRTARELVRELADTGVEIAEFQVDFDCAERHLDGYRAWVQVLRRAVAPRPVVITALPSWLRQPAMGPLVREAGEYVLQVHSLARPASAAEPFTLCDPDAARRAVDRAARLGVPFRVALPTYGYCVAFDPGGRFLGVGAEGAMPAWPEGTVLRELRAEPSAMAQLIALWTADRPGSMQGVLWYRLPVGDDRWNWRWRTLEEVMAARTPRSRLSLVLERPREGLVEIGLRNDGTDDHAGGVTAEVRWDAARWVASDGIRGFACERTGRQGIRLVSTHCRLPAGEAMAIGWVRLDADVPLEAQLLPPPDGG